MGRGAEDRDSRCGPMFPRTGREAERCITTDGLLIPNPFYNNYFQIVQAPGHVAIVTEMMHELRVIPLDPPEQARPHAGPGVRMWLGDSRGWWEGQTLVVETTNFNDRKLFRGATRQLHLVERFTRLDADTIEYRLTVTDPATFARPWTLVNGLRRSDERDLRGRLPRGQHRPPRHSRRSAGPGSEMSAQSVGTAARAG